MVLVDDCQRSDDARGPGGDPGGSQGAFSEELGRLEGLGEFGSGALVRLSSGNSKLRKGKGSPESDPKEYRSGVSF
jgi:hypothetical protein